METGVKVIPSELIIPGENIISVIDFCGFDSQVGVFVGHSGSKGYGLILAQLFMPDKWFGEDYTQLRKECAVPDDLTFQTKPQIPLDLIRKMEQSGLFKAK